MRFDYSLYLKDGIIAATIAVTSLYGVVAMLLNWRELLIRNSFSRKNAFNLLFVLLIAGACLSISISRLIHGGFIVFFEKEEDTVRLQGQIEQIEELGYWAVPRFDFESADGFRFTIDGVRCTAFEKGMLNVGDYVSVEYLPKSGFVLYISNDAEDISDGTEE